MVDMRGFFSIDAIFALFLVLTVTGMLYNSAQESREVAMNLARAQEKKMAVEKLAAAINIVYATGSTLELHRLELPENVIGKDYSVTFDSDNRLLKSEYVTGTSEDLVVSAPVIPKAVENFVLSPENLSGNIRVFWKDNRIQVMSDG